MKNVMIIANSRYPNGTANSINVFRMSAAFVSKGFKVRLVALRSSLISKERLWEEVCLRYGARPALRGTFFWLPFARGAEPVLALLSFFFLLFKNRDTLVYTRVSYVAILAVRMGFLTVFESHAPPKNNMLQKIESSLLQSDKAFVVLISEGLRKAYEVKGLDTSHTLIAPDAGRLLRASVPQREEFQGDCKNIGYIGSLYSGRGFEIIVSVAKQMPERNFHITGDLRTLTSGSNSLPENILLNDAVTPDQAERMAGTFDVLLMPYQKEVRIGNELDTSLWMSPLKMFEFMLSGRPVIASDLSALREILRNSENAILVPPDDIDAWLDALRRLDSTELRYQLAKKAYREASASYTWDSRVKAILNHLNSKFKG